MNTPDAIHEAALLTLSRWQRRAPSSQERANQLLALWQIRRELPPEQRLKGLDNAA